MGREQKFSRYPVSGLRLNTRAPDAELSLLWADFDAQKSVNVKVNVITFWTHTLATLHSSPVDCSAVFFSSFPQPLFQAQSKFCDLYLGLRQKVLQPLMDLKFAIPSLQYNTYNNDGSVTCVNSSRHSTPSRCFTPLPVCTTALRSLVFGLTPFG